MVPQRRILYVGDPGVMSARDLPSCCYEVIRTSSLQEAIRAASSSYFDLYLVGRCPSERAGAEFCCKVRAFDPNTPVLCCSGVECKDTQEHPARSTPLWELEDAIARLLGQAEAKKRERMRASRHAAALGTPRAAEQTKPRLVA
jgi:hypothetical protein